MITCDDDGGNGNQFLISYLLRSGSTYTLVVTTSGTYRTGSFSITVLGPASIVLTRITPLPSNKLSPAAIAGITIACIIVVVSIFGFFVYRCNRRRTSNQGTTYWARNQNVQPQIYSIANTGRTVTGANGVQVSYTAPASGAYGTRVERPPPSYDSVAPPVRLQV